MLRVTYFFLHYKPILFSFIVSIYNVNYILCNSFFTGQEGFHSARSLNLEYFYWQTELCLIVCGRQGKKCFAIYASLYLHGVLSDVM